MINNLRILQCNSSVPEGFDMFPDNGDDVAKWEDFICVFGDGWVAERFFGGAVI